MFLTNGDLFDKLIAESPLLRDLGNFENPEDLIEKTFQSILSRPPDAEEKERSLSFVKAKDHSSISQLIWALITSAEFRINH